MSGSPTRVTVVVSHLVPSLGMERAAVRLIETLDAVSDLRVVSLAGGSDDRSAWADVAVGSSRQLKGLRRVCSVLRARELLREDASDVRIIVGAPAALATLIATRPRARGDIVWEHSLSAERLRRSRSLRSVWRVLSRLYARVGTVVAVSPPVAELMETAAAGRTVMIPNFVDGLPADPARRPRDPDGSVRLLAVGTLSEVKNHAALLDALTRLDAGVTATIVGEGALRRDLERRATQLGLAERVRFTGHLRPHDVAHLMRTSTLLVHPSSSETFGLVYFEAAAARLPVVTADHPTARWLVPTFVPGRCVPETELDAGIRAALQSMPDEDEWNRADAARSRAFDPAVTAAAWVALVRSAATGT